MTDKTETGHWFANHGMGWAVSEESREAAIEKLLLENTDTTWHRNCLKDGNVISVYSCYVPVDIKAPYKIEWFVPRVDGVRDGANHMVTYLTKTKCAYMRDPSDHASKLRSKAEAKAEELEQALFNLSYAVVTEKSFHDPDVQKAIDEAKPLISYLQDQLDNAKAEDAEVARRESVAGA